MRDIIHSTKNSALSNEHPMATVGSVAQRFHKEIGLSKKLSRRLSKKLNNLAKKVDWAVPLPERNIPSYAYTKRAKKSAKRAGK